tara:strand:+ start:1107 stop:4064 length:2958 start_codon:yes stop_codon:yes gene_type:complete
MSKNSESIKQATAAQREFNDLSAEGKDIYREYQGIFNSISGELGKQVSYAAQAKKEYNNLASISRKLSDSQAETNRLSDKELNNLQKRAKSSADQIKFALDEVAAKQKLGVVLNDNEQALLASGKANQSQEKDFLKDIQKQIELRKKSNEAMGVAGGLLSGLTAMAGPFAKALKLDKVQQDMEKTADAVAKGNKSFGKMRVLAAGVGSAITNAFATMTDPAVVIGAIVKSMGAIAKEQKNFRQITGQNIDLQDSLNGKMINTVDYIKGAVALTKELGVNAQVVFSSETIAEVAELTENMGLGAKEAANLAKMAKISGKELSTVTAEMEASFKSFVKTNKTGLNLKDVISDVGNASAAVSLSLGSQPEKIQQAAMEARKLGLSLEQVDKIAGSLLSFESSIEAEMEAELLTGKQLNLDKARSLALNNDLAGVAKEIGKNQAILGAFASGNRIQQEATAKAMGMSRDEMAKMIYQQKIANGLTAEQAAAAADVSVSEAKRLTAQETIAKVMDKMTQGAASFLDKMMPILDNTYLIEASMIVIGAVVVGKIAKGLADAAKSTVDMAKGAASALKGMGGSKGGGDDTPDLKKKPDTKGMDKKSGEGIKAYLKGLGDGLASIGKQMGNVIKGAVALGIAGIVLGGAFAVALMMIKDVDPIQMIAFSASLAMLGLTMAVMGNIGGNIIVGALAMGILALALIPAAYAFSLLAEVDIAKMIAFSLMLPLLALAAAGLGFIAPFIAAGSAALVVLGVGMLAVSLAFGAMGGVDIEKIKILGEVLPSIGLAAAKLGIMAPFIAAGSAAMVLLSVGMLAIGLGSAAMGNVDAEQLRIFSEVLPGLGLAMAGLGFMAPFIIMGSFALGAMSLALVPLALMGPGLAIASTALMGMAQALREVGSALGEIDGSKLDKLEDFAITSAVTGAASGVMAAIASPIAALGGMLGGGDDGDDAQMQIVEKLDQLIAIVEKGGDVILDGALVGKNLAIASSKMG